MSEFTTYAEVDHALVVAMWEVIHKREEAAIDSGKVHEALSWGELLGEIRETAKEVLNDEHYPGWTLPSDRSVPLENDPLDEFHICEWCDGEGQLSGGICGQCGGSGIDNG